MVGAWRAALATGEITRDGTTERLEPKVMSLLFLLASKPGEVFTKDQIMEAVWPDVVVGDDTLAKAVSRLRKALDDDPKVPQYIETLPKRGYRLIAPVQALDRNEASAPASAVRRWPLAQVGAAAAALVLAIVMIAASQMREPAPSSAAVLAERANDFYFQYTRADNQAAIALFERILAERPDYAPALAGLANAMVQNVIRWPSDTGGREYTRLGDAIKDKRTSTPAAKTILERARVLAARAVALAPDDAASHKALGFVQSALLDFEDAIASYRRAVSLDREAWGPLINIGDVLEITGRPREALPYFEQAYAAMTAVYDQQSARIRIWYPALAVLIGDRWLKTGDASKAESWYRRVLSYAPYHVAATSHLASLLRTRGKAQAAEQLCQNLQRHAATTCTP